MLKAPGFIGLGAVHSGCGPLGLPGDTTCGMRLNEGIGPGSCNCNPHIRTS